MIRTITYFGLSVQWHGRHLLRRFVRTLRGPVLYLFSWVYILFAALDFFFARSARNFRAEWKFLRAEMHSVSDNLHKAWKKSTTTWLSVLGHYIVKALHRHRRLFKAAVNTVLPLLMAVVGARSHEKGIVLSGTGDSLPARLRPGEKPLYFVPEGDPAYTVAPYYALQEEHFTCFPMFAQAVKA